MQDGNILEQILTENDCECKFVKRTDTPSTFLYEFAFTKPVTSTKLKNAVSAAAIKLDCPFTYEQPDSIHFNVIEKLNEDERLYYSFYECAEALKSLRQSGEDTDCKFILGMANRESARVIDIRKCPHILIAGATGSGKSVFINAIIASFTCYSSPDNLKIALIDPKQVEFAQWKDSLHLYMPIAYNTQQALTTLNACADEMERRYSVLQQNGLRDNKNGTFPELVIFVDELADLMLTSKHEAEDVIVRIAQKGRAAGIHLVLATQRPTVKVVTGLIKANIPTRIAFALPTVRDSMIILDAKGAEILRGKGDGIAIMQAGETIRFQSANIDEKTIYDILEPAREYRKNNVVSETPAEPPKVQDKELHKRRFNKFLKGFALTMQWLAFVVIGVVIFPFLLLSKLFTGKKTKIKRTYKKLKINLGLEKKKSKKRQ